MPGYITIHGVNNTQYKASHCLCSQTVDLVGVKGTKAKQRRPMGRREWSGLAGGQEVCGLIMGDKAGNVSWDQTSSIQPPAAFIFFQGQRRDVHRSGATQLSSYPTSNLERSS